MSKQTKILVVADAGVNTGFERVMRGICQTLYDLGTYDITVRGIGYYSAAESKRTYPWIVKPWGGDPGDPLGVMQYRYWLMEDQPDVVLFINDVWQITNFLGWHPREVPSVAYFPVDTPNIQWNHVLGAVAATECVTYTQFGAREAAAGVRQAVDIIKRMNPEEELWNSPTRGFELPHGEMKLYFRADRLAHLQNPDKWNVLPHGLDLELFTPRSKREARDRFGIAEDAFIVLSVGTNQFRKRHDLTLRSFLKLSRVAPNAHLLLHCQGGDKGGWDLTNLIEYYGLAGKVTLTHRLIGENITEDQLVWLYNTADIQINTSGGEGWGLTSFEGAACGVPQLVPDWSATRELWKGYGRLIKVADWRHEPKPSNPAHAIIDCEHAGDELIRFYQSDLDRKSYAATALANAARVPSWKEVGGAFHTVIQQALNVPAPILMTLNDVSSNRVGEVRSELAGRVSLKDPITED